MRNKTCNTWLAVTSAVVLLAMVALPAHGQIRYGQPLSGRAHFIFSHWSLEDDSVSTEIDQMTVPFTGFVPIRENLEALVYVASSSNSLTQGDTDYDLSGLGDVRVQINRSFSDDRLLFSVGVNLPTGKKELSQEEELPILEFLTQNYLSFPMRRFGQGFGASALLGGAQMLGQLRCGASVMYQFNGSYTPYEGVGDYDPGDFISASAGADWQKNEVTVSGDAIFTLYSKDKAGDADVFKQSTQFDFRLGLVYDDADYRLNAGLGYLLRGRNTLYRPTEVDERIFGNELRISADLTRRFQPGWSVGPAVDVKFVGANEQGFESSTIFGVGGNVSRAIGEQVALSVGGRYYTGSADGGDIDVSGFQITAGLTGSL